MTSFNLATYSPDADFVGYATDGGSTRPVTCSPTLSWTTSNNYAACASTTGRADIATGCYDGSLVYTDGYQTCATAGSTCEAIRIYNKEGDSAPLWTQYNCVHNWNAFSVYRTLTDTSTSTSIPNTASITAAPTASTGSTVYPVSNSTSHSGLSGGAIAGIAIGGAAVILIVLYLIFRRQLLACCGYTRAPMQEPTYAPVLPMQAAEPHNPEPHSRSSAPYNAPYSPVSLSTDSRRVSQAQSPPPGWDKPELSATSGPYQTELPAFNDPVQPELPAYSRPVGPPRANAHEME